MEKKEKKIFNKKNRKWFIIFGIIILVAISFFVFKKNGGNGTNFVEVKRGEIISEVSVTGIVVPSKNVDLAFERGGKITRIAVKVGDKVGSGQTLVQLENSDLFAQVAQARASLQMQQSKLDELNKGTREEEIKVKEAELAKAEQDLQNYYVGVRDVLNDAYAKADDAVRTKTDNLFTDDETQNPKLTFTASDLQSQIDVIALRVRAGSELNTWKGELQTINYSTPSEELEKELQYGKNHLAVVRDYLSRAMDVVDSSVGLSVTTISAYKLDINTGRTNTNIAFTSLSTQSQAIASQKVVVQRTEDELSLKRAGATAEQIAGQEAQIAQAEANVLYYESQLEKTYIHAPFSGVITKIDAKLGDIISANVLMVSLIGSGNFEIESNITESDIAKIKIGNKARVTLDAYGNDVMFNAVVSKKNLSETIIDGVPTYKTTLQFEENDERILSGLTANVDILADKKENILYIPSRNIFSKDGKKTAKVLQADGTVREIEITTGLRGSDGKTEILSGLTENEKVTTE